MGTNLWIWSSFDQVGISVSKELNRFDLMTVGPHVLGSIWNV